MLHITIWTWVSHCNGTAAVQMRIVLEVFKLIVIDQNQYYRVKIMLYYYCDKVSR